MGNPEHHQRGHVTSKHILAIVDKYRKQPQGGASPGGDSFPQQWEQDHQHPEVQGEQSHQLGGGFHQEGGADSRTGRQEGGQPQNSDEDGKDPGGKPDHGVSLFPLSGGAAGLGHLLFIAPLPAEGKGHGQPHQQGENDTEDPAKVSVIVVPPPASYAAPPIPPGSPRRPPGRWPGRPPSPQRAGPAPPGWPGPDSPAGR